MNFRTREDLDGARAEFDLADLERRGPGPCSAADIERVRADAMRAIAVLPDPEEFAAIFETAEPALAGALRAGFLFNEPNQEHTYRLRREDQHQAQRLARLGLVEVKGLYLTGFGIAVRRAMLEEGRTCTLK